METPLLQTKLYIAPPRPDLIPRPRLIERLNEGLHRKLSLISAPAGYGKTTLVADWLGQIDLPAAWLSLDEGDNDPTRFLTYCIAALQQFETAIGQTTQSLLQSPQPPPPETLVITLINDMAAIYGDYLLILDDYHVIDTPAIHETLTFLLDHMPPQMHLVITTRPSRLCPWPACALGAR